MIVERPAAARGHVQAGWLDSRHTFSFGSYYDPDWMGFGVLRVINEDRVAPGAGFAAHRHANMEILSYVLDGALAHRDSLGGLGDMNVDVNVDMNADVNVDANADANGGAGVIGAGQLQWMSAGHGVEHSEFNASDTQPVHFLQIWLQPDRVNATPAYALHDAGRAGGRRGDGWQLLASADGRQRSIAIRQDASLQRARLDAGSALVFELERSRRYWLHVVRGAVDVDRPASASGALRAGDALGFVDESAALQLRCDDGAAEVLLFDLPL